MIFFEKITATGIFSRKEMPQEFSRENYCAKMVRNGNTCCKIWSEPYVPAAYSGIPFIRDVLAVPFFVEEACGRGGVLYGERVIIFLEKKDDGTFELREVDGAGCDKLRGVGGSGWRAFLEARG